MLNLRDYQADNVQRVQAAWLQHRSVLNVLPTGGGKTVCFASIMHDHQGAKAAVVHRREIVGQISMALARLDVKHRIIAPPATVQRIRKKHLRAFGKSFIDPHALAGVISVQTLTSKSSANNAELQRWLQQITLAVFDEGHHYVSSGFWARAVDCMARAKLLFVTATPERADGKGLGVRADGFAETIVIGPSTKWLIERGYLSPFVYKAPATDLDVSGIAVTASGDFNSKALRSRVVESHLVGDIVQHYHRHAAGKQCIVFATDVKTAGEIADTFKATGVVAAALSAETDERERDRELEAFEAGTVQVLVNVDLFDEGFDVPAVDAVILARPTESLAKYLQMVGRALRVVYASGFDLSIAEGRRQAIARGGKPNAIIIDPVRNWERHGMPDWPRAWTLDGREKGSRREKDDLQELKSCVGTDARPGCTQLYAKYLRVCPYCGVPVPPPKERSTPEQVDGDLIELDVEAMAALFEKMQRADMSDGDYSRDMIARGVPQIARGIGMRRHQENKYRRQVLRELVGWWVGAQGDRDIREIHRRFFHRFGVDIVTAFTLKAAETDALIETIKARFGDDL